jgi:hypothetical protein
MALLKANDETSQDPVGAVLYCIAIIFCYTKTSGLHPTRREAGGVLAGLRPDARRSSNQKYLKFSHISPFPVGSLVMRVQPS